MNEIEVTRKAERQLRRIHPDNIRRIFAAIEKLKTFPDCQGNIVALQNHVYDYRLRVGNYRVLFNFDQTIKIISLEEVKKRDEQTY